MVQTRMVGNTIACLWLRQADHAGMPVMLPHDSDSQVRRDGSDAASSVQLLHAVDERGRLHGVPALCRLQRLPVLARRRIGFTALEKKRQSRILTSTNAQLRRQAKRTAVMRPYVVGAIEQCTAPHKPPAGAFGFSSNKINALSASGHRSGGAPGGEGCWRTLLGGQKRTKSCRLLTGRLPRRISRGLTLCRTF